MASFIIFVHTVVCTSYMADAISFLFFDKIERMSNICYASYIYIYIYIFIQMFISFVVDKNSPY